MMSSLSVLGGLILMVTSSSQVPLGLDPARVVGEARSLMASGETSRAAALLWDSALSNPHRPESLGWVEYSSSLLVRQGRIDGAVRNLDLFSRRMAQRAAVSRLKLRQALIYLGALRPEEARPILDALATTSLPGGARLELELLRARVDFLAAAGPRSVEARRSLHRSEARERLLSLWTFVYGALRGFIGADQLLFLHLAEAIVFDLAENDLWFSDEKRVRELLEQKARECRGSALGLTFERRLADLAFSGKPFPAPSGHRLVPWVGARPTPGQPTFTLSSGKIRLVQIWASWCPPATAAWEEVDALVRSLSASSDLEVIGISIDEPERLSKLTDWLASRRPSWTQLWEPQAWSSPFADALELPTRGIPLRLLVDENGSIICASLSGVHLELEIRRQLDRLRARTRP